MADQMNNVGGGEGLPISNVGGPRNVTPIPPPTDDARITMVGDDRVTMDGNLRIIMP